MTSTQSYGYLEASRSTPTDDPGIGGLGATTGQSANRVSAEARQWRRWLAGKDRDD